MSQPISSSQSLAQDHASNGSHPEGNSPAGGTGDYELLQHRGLQDIGPFEGHSPDQERPLGGYLMLIGTFSAGCAAFMVWFRASNRSLPERVEGRDVALMSVATYKITRVIAKDRVTSAVRAPFTTFQDDAGPGEVDEAARGNGPRRAIGELLICPYCLGVWVSSALCAGLVTAPRLTRAIAATFTSVSAADLLHIGYKKAEDVL